MPSGLGSFPHRRMGRSRFAHQAQEKNSYIDALGVELEAKSPAHVLVTPDFDLKPASKDVQIEFLPTSDLYLGPDPLPLS